ncbi:MAG: hypothetical protein IKZ76_03240 [Lachnospiraceae bacterium]|nr:hypothetical protein [Lachnospiraceae bacterium]
MNHIDVLDKTITINGQAIDFPMSYEEIKKVLGNARIVEDTSGKSVQTSYYYDELGIEFDGSPAYLSNLKKKKAYKDNDHNIVGLTLYVSGNIIYDFKEEKCEKKYVGNLTVLGNQIDRSKTYRGALGFGYCPLLDEKGKDKKHIQVSISIISTSESVFTVDDDPFYDGDVLLRDVIISFQPERPKSKVNYTIVIPDEECLVFDTFNFKLAVINELMYNRQILEPYFDIYDFMAFKKAHWNLETDKNIRAAVDYFKELPIPVRFADYVTEINMDGSDEIYMNIAPEWDGSDERFDFNKLSEAELKQFKNLKKMLIIGNDKDAEKLRKICTPLGIEVEPLVTMES